MRRFHLWLGAALLLLASAAGANWSKAPDGTTMDCDLSIRTTCYYNFSDTTDSGILVTDMCKSVTIGFDADLASTSDGTGAEIYVMRCASKTISANSCTRVYSDAGAVTLNGNPAVGRSAIYEIVANFIYIDVDENDGSDDARVEVQCVR